MLSLLRAMTHCPVLSLCCQLLPTPRLVVLSQVGCFCTPPSPALQLGKQNQLSKIFPRGSSSLWLSCWLSEELAFWAGPLSLLSLFQPPQTWHSGKWAQGREEEISYLAVSPGDLLGGAEPPLPEGTQDLWNACHLSEASCHPDPLPT